jgi:hypothetical protein
MSSRESNGQITEEMVKRYYKEDKMTWAVFLAFRRFDRWFMLKLLRKNYNFILPAKIKR